MDSFTLFESATPTEFSGSSPPSQSPRFSAAWPSSGTMRSGIVYQRQPLVPPTFGFGSSSWPTPKATSSGPDLNRRNRKRHGTDDLVTALVRRALWPTPSAQLFNQSEDPDEWLTRRKKWQGKKGYGAGVPLAVAVKLYPTPSSTDYKGSSRVGQRAGQLSETVLGPPNPPWVEWLMGFPMGWTDLKRSVMPSFRKSRSGSANRSSTSRVDANDR